MRINQEKTTERATRIFAVIGLIVVLGIGLWGVTYVARSVPSAFSAVAAAITGISSIFVPADEATGEPVATSTPEAGGDEPTTDAPTRTAGEETSQVIPIGNAGRVSDPNGRVDLAPRIVATGIIENGEFVATSTINADDHGAVRFEIENLGTKTSPEWTFNAVLPTSPIHIYSSDAQRPLAPGDRIIYTLGFNRTKPGERVAFVVNADPRNNINEANKENNIVRVTLEIK